jgi:hypothetical protein
MSQDTLLDEENPTKHQRDVGLFIVIEAVGPLGPNLLVQIVEEL